MITDTDIDGLLQFIHASLNSPETVDEDLMRDEAVAYNDMCFEVNSQLTTAARLIDRGLRDDAVALAGRDGELLTLYEKLDFPEREVWIELVDAFGLPKPPELDEDAAAKLNIAYAVLGDLQALLSKHRLFALARVPLQHRIRILNELAQQDPENPLWQSDAEKFQQARLTQLAGEIARAASADDIEALTEIQQELAGCRWWIPIPPKLAAQVRTAVAINQQRQWIDQIRTAGERLQIAYSEFDLATGDPLADSIRTLAANATLMPDDPLMLEIAPALQWVDEQRAAIESDRQDQIKIDNLERILSRSDASHEDVQRVFDKAKLIGTRLPAPLRQRAQERLASFEMIARRRTMMIVSAAVLLLAMIGSAAGFAIIHSRHETAMELVESRFQEMIENEQWAEAQAFYDKQTPAAQGRPAMQAGAVTVWAGTKDEQERAEKFAAILEQLKADDGHEPNDSLLNQLKSLSKTKPDELAVLDQENIAAKKRAAIQQKLATEQRLQFGELKSQVDAAIGQSGTDRRQAIDSAFTATKRMLAAVHSTAPELGYELKGLERILEREIAKDQAANMRRLELDKISRGVGDPETYVDLIRQFVDRFPNDPMASELAQTSQRIAEWELVANWNEVIGSSVCQDPHSATPEEAQAWLKRLDAAISADGNHCLAVVPKQRRAEIERISKRSQAIESLQRLAASEQLDPWFVYSQNGLRYYSPSNPEHLESDANTIAYVVDASFLQRPKLFNRSDFQNEIRPNAYLAGQSAFGDQFRQISNRMTPKRFSEDCYRILNTLHQTPETRIDPIFKLILFRHLLATMLPASHSLDEAFGNFSRQLTEDAFRWNTDWITLRPESHVDETRQAASALLKQLDNWSERVEQIKRVETESQFAKVPTLRWVGWMAKTDDHWTARMASPTKADLGVVRHSGTTSVFRSIGNGGGGPNVAVDHVEAHQAGLPVYAVEQSD
ncbi:hypothetical protein [Rosistilla oblonga]|uniref:hypothetical protein n=1 Tax=Rosistilla oblonga TaxID=2527990 RepID=UPI003A97AB64